MVPLTNPNSAHSRWLQSLAVGAKNPDIPDDLVYAVASVERDFEIQVMGWASIYCWVNRPALEAFVAPDFRNQRVGSCLAAAVVLASGTPVDHVAVFSGESSKIARWLGFSEVARFKPVEDGWVQTNE